MHTGRMGFKKAYISFFKVQKFIEAIVKYYKYRIYWKTKPYQRSKRHWIKDKAAEHAHLYSIF